MRPLTILFIMIIIIPTVYGYTALYKANNISGNKAWGTLDANGQKPSILTPTAVSSTKEFNLDNYSAILVRDSINATGDIDTNADPDANDYEVMLYQINITQDISTISAINITWEGSSSLDCVGEPFNGCGDDDYGVNIFLYNFSSGSWKMALEGENSTSSVMKNILKINVSQNQVNHFINESNSSVLWMQVQSAAAGSPHIYAFNGTDHIFIVDAVPFAFMKSLERITYAEIKKEYLSEINGKYVLRV